MRIGSVCPSLTEKIKDNDLMEENYIKYVGSPNGKLLPVSHSCSMINPSSLKIGYITPLMIIL